MSLVASDVVADAVVADTVTVLAGGGGYNLFAHVGVLRQPLQGFQDAGPSLGLETMQVFLKAAGDKELISPRPHGGPFPPRPVAPPDLPLGPAQSPAAPPGCSPDTPGPLAPPGSPGCSPTPR